MLCVTHLAQIACFADHHYVVEKREQKGRTVATIEELDDAARTREIGRMLSGQKAHFRSLEARRAADRAELQVALHVLRHTNGSRYFRLI